MPTPKAPKKLNGNGNGADPMTVGITGPATPRPIYTFADGTQVVCQGLPPMVFWGAQSDAGKPEAPARLVMMAGGATQRVQRDDDEPVLTEEQIAKIKDLQKQQEEREYREYRLKLTAWEADVETRMMRLVSMLGVVDGPGPDDVGFWQFIGYTDPFDIKHMWLMAKLTTQEQINDFYTFIVGVTIPTEEGTAQAEAAFPGEVSGEPEPVARPDGLSTAETETQAASPD